MPIGGQIEHVEVEADPKSVAREQLDRLSALGDGRIHRLRQRRPFEVVLNARSTVSSLTMRETSSFPAVEPGAHKAPVIGERPVLTRGDATPHIRPRQLSYISLRAESHTFDYWVRLGTHRCVGR